MRSTRRVFIARLLLVCVLVLTAFGGGVVGRITSRVVAPSRATAPITVPSPVSDPVPRRAFVPVRGAAAPSVQSRHQRTAPYPDQPPPTVVTAARGRQGQPERGRQGRRPLLAATSASAITGLHVAGNQILNGNNTPIVLRGVDRMGSEYACVGNSDQGYGFFDTNATSVGPVDQSSVNAMLAWGVNAVRLPLNEDCWLGINLPSGNTYQGAAYQTAIQNYVSLLNSNGIAVILDLQWGQPGTIISDQSGPVGNGSGLEPMPDAAHAGAFWTSVATAFKSNTSVLFDAFNEPFPDNNTVNSTAAWTCWRDGGNCSTAGITYTVAGMQTLVTNIRNAGATTQPIMLGGINYSNSLQQWLTYKPTDPNNGLVASWHSYSTNACNTQTCWDQYIAPVAASVPVLAGEIGENDCATGYINPLMTYLDGKGIGYLGWSWSAYNCGGTPSLLAGISGTTYTASAYGTGLQSHLVSLANSTATPGPSPTPAALTAGTVYDGNYENGWSDYSYSFTHTVTSTSPVYGGDTQAIQGTFVAGGYGSVKFHQASFTPTGYGTLHFAVHMDGTTGDQFTVNANDSTGAALGAGVYITPTLNAWTAFDIPVSSLDITPTAMTDFSIHEYSGKGATISVDDVRFVAAPATNTPLATNTPVATNTPLATNTPAATATTGPSATTGPAAAAGPSATPAPGSVAVTINTGTTLAVEPTTGYGMNDAVWDSHATDTSANTAMRQLNMGIMRMPGGSTADDYHWANNTVDNGPNYPGHQVSTTSNPAGTPYYTLAQTALNAGMQPLMTFNYGTNATLNGPNTTADDVAWVKDANVTRGLGIKYWEQGNENFGGGYYDYSYFESNLNNNRTPQQYASDLNTNAAAMKAVDPTILVGASLEIPGYYPWGAGTNQYLTGGNGSANAGVGPTGLDWNNTVIANACNSIGFIDAHWYPINQTTGTDAQLLGSVHGYDPASQNKGGANPSSFPGPAGIMSELRNELTAYCPAHASQIKIFIGESNSNSDTPQRVSIVDGLFAADQFPTWLENGAANASWWDLHNGPNNNHAAPSGVLVDGNYSDLGVLSAGAGSEPAANTPFPSWYGMRLDALMASPGDSLVQATSPLASLVVHAAKRGDGTMGVLLINEDPSNSHTAALNIAGFTPVGTAATYSYGQAQASTANYAAGIVTGTAPAVQGMNVTVAPYTMETLVLQPSGGASTPTPTPTTPPAPSNQVPLAGVFNVPGIVADGTTFTTANSIDGCCANLSSNALAAAGYTGNSTLTYGGNVYTTGPTTGNDVIRMAGQTINLGGQMTGTSLSIIGFGVTGTQTGNVTVQYTNGTTGSFPLALPDWIQGGTTNQVLQSAYRVNTNGTTDPNNKPTLYNAQVGPLTAGISSITLPTNNNMYMVAASVIGGAPAAMTTATPTAPTLPATTSTPVPATSTPPALPAATNTSTPLSAATPTAIPTATLATSTATAIPTATTVGPAATPTPYSVTLVFVPSTVARGATGATLVVAATIGSSAFLARPLVTLTLATGTTTVATLTPYRAPLFLRAGRPAFIVFTWAVPSTAPSGGYSVVAHLAARGGTSLANSTPQPFTLGA